MIWLIIKLLIELCKSQNLHKNVIQRHEHDKETTKERYIPPEERQKSVDHLRLI